MGPKVEEICFEIPEDHCKFHELAPLTNRWCEGQQKDICFHVPETECTKDRREHCLDIPTITCEKKFIKKCFTVPVPPQLIQVPKIHCRGRRERKVNIATKHRGHSPYKSA